MSNNLRNSINKQNKELFIRLGEKLKPEELSPDAIEWIAMEHFQFSLNNAVFLLIGSNTTQVLSDRGVTKELRRNFLEEIDHGGWYNQGLKEIGTNVIEKHIPFQTTNNFLKSIRDLVSGDPSIALGALYAIEGVAIDELTLLNELHRKLSEYRNIDYDKTSLKSFHDCHLQGVEQSHVEELGVFIDPNKTNSANTGIAIDFQKVNIAANQVLHSMKSWWESLLIKIDCFR